MDRTTGMYCLVTVVFDGHMQVFHPFQVSSSLSLKGHVHTRVLSTELEARTALYSQ